MKSKEEAVSPSIPATQIQLLGCIAEMLPSRPNPKKYKFVIKRTEDQFVLATLGALRQEEIKDWVEAINNAVPLESAQQTQQLPSRRESSMSLKNHKVGIADFDFHCVLGKGNFGKVLLCSHRPTKKLYAIKIIPKSHGPNAIASAQVESKVLRSIKHPFIVGLHFAFQNQERLYLVMEYVNGGDLYFHLSHERKFTERRVRFYAAEMLLALQSIHGKGLVYRDLKLENILLSKDGHIKIADFGLCGKEGIESEILSGTIEYFAPELFRGSPFTFAADWWAYGIVLFGILHFFDLTCCKIGLKIVSTLSLELLCGFHPFYHAIPEHLCTLITSAPLTFPPDISPVAKNFLSRLLTRDPEKRLGSGPWGSKEIQDHPFFEGLDWNKLFKCEIEPHWKPDIDNDFDTKYFAEEFTNEGIHHEGETQGLFGSLHRSSFVNSLQSALLLHSTERDRKVSGFSFTNIHNHLQHCDDSGRSEEDNGGKDLTETRSSENNLNALDTRKEIRRHSFSSRFGIQSKGKTETGNLDIGRR
ncbi:kinase-like domain-containing protein [Paraphysoderma sedebokerense]|nr:kinase-like domain-containing protein [Paraphysoderma sedebokerense]